MTNKQRYKEFCGTQADLPLMLQWWWMDAVCAGKDWDALLFTARELEVRTVAPDTVVAAMPYLIRRRAWVKYILMPQLTQTGGVWMDELLLQNEQAQQLLVQLLRDRLRKMHLYYYQQSYPMGSPIPELLQQFRRFTLLEHVTYNVRDLSDMANVVSSFSKNKQRQLKKAESLQVDFDMTGEELFAFIRRSLTERMRRPAYSREFLLVLERKAARYQCGQIIRLTDGVSRSDGTIERRTVAAAFVVWDNKRLYYLVPAFLSSAGNNGASARLVVEAMKIAAERGLIFDFEGGNDPGIRNHYSQFGAEQTAYWIVTRSYRPLFSLALRINKWRERHIWK